MNAPDLHLRETRAPQSNGQVVLAFFKWFITWSLIGLSLGWLSSWSSGSVETFRAALLGVLVGTTGMLALRTSSVSNIPVSTVALLLVTYTAGVSLGESEWAMKEKWGKTHLSECQLARAAFSKSLTIPADALACPLPDASNNKQANANPSRDIRDTKPAPPTGAKP